MSATDKATSNVQTPSQLSTPGVSGRKLTITILGSLAIVGGCLAYLLSVYDQMDDQRAKTKEVWRSLANSLDSNYKAIQSLQAADLGADEAWKQQFNELAEQFRTATNIETQTSTANQMERQLSQLSSSSTDPKLPKIDQGLKDEIERYNQSIDRELSIMSSLAGSFVHKILPAPVRSRLDVSR